MDYSTHTDDELATSLAAEREQMTTWARIADAAPTRRARRSAEAEHDRAQATCLAILDEMRNRCPTH